MNAAMLLMAVRLAGGNVRLWRVLTAALSGALLAQADALGLYVVGTLDIGPMTEGDVSAMAALGADLALDVQEV